MITFAKTFKLLCKKPSMQNYVSSQLDCETKYWKIDLQFNSIVDGNDFMQIFYVQCLTQRRDNLPYYFRSYVHGNDM
jgi:hypothetical protein